VLFCVLCVKDARTEGTSTGSRIQAQAGRMSHSRTASEENHRGKVSEHGQYLAAAGNQKEASGKEVN